MQNWERESERAREYAVRRDYLGDYSYRNHFFSFVFSSRSEFYVQSSFTRTTYRPWTRLTIAMSQTWFDDLMLFLLLQIDRFISFSKSVYCTRTSQRWIIRTTTLTQPRLNGSRRVPWIPRRTSIIRHAWIPTKSRLSTPPIRTTIRHPRTTRTSGTKIAQSTTPTLTKSKATWKRVNSKSRTLSPSRREFSDSNVSANGSWEPSNREDLIIYPCVRQRARAWPWYDSMRFASSLYYINGNQCEMSSDDNSSEICENSQRIDSHMLCLRETTSS